MPNLALAFDVLLRDRASQGLDKLGDKADRTGKKVESSSGRAGKAFGLLGKTFASSSAGALGPLQELTDKLEVFETASEQGGSKASARIFGIGLAATAAGSFIESLHSREQAATQQLQASIETTGHSYADYAEEVEKAVKSGERFGNQASVTTDALNRLVTTTHNPEEAFKGLAVEIDVAAEKHITLAKAAELVGLTFNGSTRAGKQFGLQLENTTGAVKALSTAQNASKSATAAAKTAQQTYAEKLDLWNNSATKSRAGAYALANAHQRLVEAQDKAKSAADRVKVAQDKASEAHEAGARNVAKLAAVVKGQGSAAADTFTGHLKALGAQIEDTLGAQGKLGGTLVTVGVLASAVGSLGQAGAFSALGRLIGRVGLTGTAFKTLRDVEIASSAEGSAGVVAGAATAEAAMVTEGATAVTMAAKIRGAFAGIAGIGIGSLLLTSGDSAGNGKVKRPDLAKILEEIAAKANGSNTDPTKGVAAELNKVLGEKPGGKASTKIDTTGAINFILKYGDLTDTKTRSALSTLGYNFPSFTSQQATQLKNDLNSDDPKTAARARASIAKTIHATKKTATDGGKDAGDAYLQALLKQLSAQSASDAVKKAATDQAQAAVDAITTVFQAAQSRLQSLVSASLSLRQSVTSALQGGSALTDIFQGQDLNANGAFGKQNNFGRVRDFLQRRVAQERRFVLELRALIKQGLDPSLVAQIASAGVDGGQRIAEAILSGGKGGIGQVNSLERQIASLANTTGKTVSDQHFAQQIAEQRRTTEVLGQKLDTANGYLARLQSSSSTSSTSSKLRTNAALSGV